MTLTLQQLEHRFTPAVVGVAGQLIEINDLTGNQVRVRDAFEPSYDGPLQVAVNGDVVLVGAGIGGGPRIQAYDAESWAPLWSVFVGDQSNRDGVSVAAWSATTVEVERIEYANQQLPVGFLTADSDVSSLAIRSAEEAILDVIPDQVIRTIYSTNSGVNLQTSIDYRIPVLGLGGAAHLPSRVLATGDTVSSALLAHEITHTWDFARINRDPRLVPLLDSLYELQPEYNPPKTVGPLDHLNDNRLEYHAGWRTAEWLGLEIPGPIQERLDAIAEVV